MMEAGTSIAIQELKAVGWQYKTGSGLVSYYYFPPDVSRSSVPKNAQGQFYTSEEGAIAFATQRARGMFQEERVSH